MTSLRRTLFVIGALLATALPAAAHLALGAAAPPFTVQVATGGTISTFRLARALAEGPVVLYFFPQSFTSGCTAEAHDFAEHIREFKALGARVVGISGDPIATQAKFSTQECRAAFPVAADPGLAVAKAYGAVILNLYADRTSYVIAPNGTIAYEYTSLDPDRHVANTLAALRSLHAAR